MPPDVFLVLASSGLTFVASLLFFVSEDVAPVEAQAQAEPEDIIVQMNFKDELEDKKAV